MTEIGSVIFATPYDSVKVPPMILDSIGVAEPVTIFAFVTVFSASGVFPYPKSTAPFGIVSSSTIMSSTSPPRDWK